MEDDQREAMYNAWKRAEEAKTPKSDREPLYEGGVRGDMNVIKKVFGTNPEAAAEELLDDVKKYKNTIYDLQKRCYYLELKNIGCDIDFYTQVVKSKKPLTKELYSQWVTIASEFQMFPFPFLSKGETLTMVDGWTFDDESLSSYDIYNYTTK